MRRIIESIVSVFAFLLSVATARAFSIFRDRIIVREISPAVTLNQQWLELPLERPLKVERGTQDIVLYPDPPIQMVFAPNSSELVPEDGRSADLTAELISSNNEIYQSTSSLAYTMSGDLKRTSQLLKFKGLPKDEVFNTVRIKSSAIYPVKKIVWRCYNWAEVYK